MPLSKQAKKRSIFLGRVIDWDYQGTWDYFFSVEITKSIS
jgi:hypothetical protein